MERIGKNVKIIYDDGRQVVPKEGKITAEDEFSITLNENEIIPKHRIIRIEVKPNV